MRRVSTMEWTFLALVVASGCTLDFDQFSSRTDAGEDAAGHDAANDGGEDSGADASVGDASGDASGDADSVDSGADTGCARQASSRCDQGDVYWYDACGQRGERRALCANGCYDTMCFDCVQDCDGRMCGDDSCGGECGACTVNQTCTPDGECVCESHASMACGTDGDLYWRDACGGQQELAEECDHGCANGACIPPVRLTLVLVGDGEITVSGQTPCSNARCQYEVPTGTTLTLDVATTSAPLTAWIGACSGAGDCEVEVHADTSVTAVFGEHNFMFVTAATYNGNLGGLDGADAICAAAANNKIPGQFKAWLTTPAVPSIAMRFGSARGWVRLDGKAIGDTVADLASGEGWYPPLFDENGNAVYAEAWTGTSGQSNMHCESWTSAADMVGSNVNSGVLGYVQAAPRVWTGSMNTSCTRRFHLICAGVDYASEVRPVTSTGRLAFLSDGAFIPSTGLAAADALCAQEASDAGRVGTFKALLSTSTASAASRFSSSGATWVTPDGVRLFDRAADLAAGLPFLAPIAQTADRAWQLDYPLGAWAGAAAANETSNFNCTDWTSSLGEAYRSRLWGFVGPNYFAEDTYNCTLALRVLCFQE